VVLKEPSKRRHAKRRNFERTAGCEPVPRGWSQTMRRWLAAQTAQEDVAEHWTAAVLNQPLGPATIAGGSWNWQRGAAQHRLR
jgi:hypothetical protein